MTTRGCGKSTMRAEQDMKFLLGECVNVNRPKTVLEETEDGKVLASTRLNLEAKVVDRTDDLLVKAMVDWAWANGVTHLYLIDEEFVKTAIMNEIERRKINEQND